MSQPHGPGPSDDGERPSWMGAPGYTPHPPNLAPHAPMPGAPPYPPYEEHPPPRITTDRGRTGFLRALGASLVWAAVSVLLAAAIVGSRFTAFALGYAVGGAFIAAALAAVPTWLVLRRRARPYPVVLLVALPFFLVLRLITAVGAAS